MSFLCVFSIGGSDVTRVIARASDLSRHRRAQMFNFVLMELLSANKFESNGTKRYDDDVIVTSAGVRTFENRIQEGMEALGRDAKS